MPRGLVCEPADRVSVEVLPKPEPMSCHPLLFIFKCENVAVITFSFGNCSCLFPVILSGKRFPFQSGTVSVPGPCIHKFSEMRFSFS